MKLKILSTLMLAVPLLMWSCAKNTAAGGNNNSGGGNNNLGDNLQSGNNITGSNTEDSQTANSGLADCFNGSNAFGAVNSILQNNCVGCHGGNVASAQNALDLSSTNTTTLRGALGGVNQLKGTNSASSLVSYIVSSSHPGSRSVNVSQSNLQATFQSWFDAELSCINNSGSSDSSFDSNNNGSVGSGAE